MGIIVKTFESDLVLNGIEYYRIGKVSQIVGKSVQTIKLWDKWSDDLATNGSERLIPASFRYGGQGVRYWTEEDIEKINNFSKSIKYGDMAKFSRTRWGIRAETFTRDLSTETRRQTKLYRVAINKNSKKIQSARRIEQIKVARGNMLRAVRCRARSYINSAHEN